MSHGNACEGGKAHGSIDANAALHGRDGGAVAEVAGDDLEVLDVPPEILRRLARNILVGGAVCAVSADMVCLVIVIVDGVHVGVVGHGGMEGGIEDEGHLLAGHDGATGIYAQNGRGIVEGRELGDLLHRDHHFIGDEGGLLEGLARSDDAVADGVDLIHGGNDARLLIDELTKDEGDGLGVVGQLLLDDEGLAVCLVGELAAGDADALAPALGEHGLVLHVDELIFERGTPRIDDENFHILPLCIFCFHFRGQQERRTSYRSPWRHKLIPPAMP